MKICEGKIEEPNLRNKLNFKLTQYSATKRVRANIDCEINPAI